MLSLLGKVLRALLQILLLSQSWEHEKGRKEKREKWRDLGHTCRATVAWPHMSSDQCLGELRVRSQFKFRNQPISNS